MAPKQYGVYGIMPIQYGRSGTEPKFLGTVPGRTF
ncbi:hypothetical protein [Cynomolgus macaque cytomegalovirus strain Mauritius]|uniref:Uncharacterized protein n=1 Tax=Cynomolgus macaque cytomegalovirus strain Mauritius TaxID=1690255 RepID=A0A0K1H0X7_9BETA|nr:hypothetical protein [Cynomolgus macaque cytomegalovirus strain Mauritius]